MTANQVQQSPKMPCTPCTHILVSLILKNDVELSQALNMMREEMVATAYLYLGGKLQQWFSQLDSRGVLFLFSAPHVDEVRTLMSTLPFVRADLVNLQFIRLGPLAPMQVLLQGEED